MKRKISETIEQEQKNIAFHCTNVDPTKIEQEGFKLGNGFTNKNYFEDLYKKYLPKIPVFISGYDAKVWDNNSKYCIELNISGLELYPDFGHLIDFGAYYDEDNECFYWEDENDITDENLKKWVLQNCDEYLTLYAQDFSGKDSLELLGTACIDGNKLKNRIVRSKAKRKKYV